MSVHYKLAAGQPAFTTATRVKGPIPSYPITRDTTAVVYTEDWWQLRANYTPLARDTVHPTIAGAYLVEETSFADVGGGILSWQRLYATIPAARSDPGGTTTFRYPAFPSSVIGAEKTVSSLSGTGATQTVNCTAHGYVVGQFVKVEIDYSNGGVTGTAKVFRAVSAVVSANSFRLGGEILGPSFTFVSGTTAPARAGRNNPTTRAVDTLVDYTYALPGVTPGIATLTDFRADEQFVARDAEGLETEALVEESDPSGQAYALMVATSQYLVASSTVTVYAGNILERATTRVLAR